MPRSPNQRKNRPVPGLKGTAFSALEHALELERTRRQAAEVLARRTGLHDLDAGDRLQALEHRRPEPATESALGMVVGKRERRISETRRAWESI
jgi:hypothetical protein